MLIVRSVLLALVALMVAFSLYVIYEAAPAIGAGAVETLDAVRSGY
jgi:zona occludens toxin (predicted ATPase)